MNYRKIPYYGLFAALAILMGYVEFMIPVPVPIPGVKLGLTNVIVIIMLYFMDAKSAFFVSLIRVHAFGTAVCRLCRHALQHGRGIMQLCGDGAFAENGEIQHDRRFCCRRYFS